LENQPLSQADIDAIMRALLPAGGGDLFQSKSGAVRPYDFRRPTKFKKDVLRTLVMIHENFARLLQSFFMGHLRIRAQIHVRHTNQYSLSEYLQLLPNPTVVGTLRMDPLPGTFFMEVSPNIAFATIDRVFGGSGADVQPQRALSEIERGVVQRLFADLMGPLQEAWRHVADVSPALNAVETNPMFLQSGASSEVVAAITIGVEIGEHMGHITLALPHSMVDPLLSRLTAKSMLSAEQSGANGDSAELKQRVAEAEVTVEVHLGKARVTVGEFSNIAVGDILTLNTTVSGEVPVYVGERLAFLGRPGTVGKRLSVQVRRVLAVVKP
jgi:flagellar motor switch protein FliM